MPLPLLAALAPTAIGILGDIFQGNEDPREEMYKKAAEFLGQFYTGEETKTKKEYAAESAIGNISAGRQYAAAGSIGSLSSYTAPVQSSLSRRLDDAMERLKTQKAQSLFGLEMGKIQQGVGMQEKPNLLQILGSTGKAAVDVWTTWDQITKENEMLQGYENFFTNLQKTFEGGQYGMLGAGGAPTKGSPGSMSKSVDGEYRWEF